MQRVRVDLPRARVGAGGLCRVGADRLGIVRAQAVAKAGLVARLELGAVDRVCGAREQAEDDGGDAERGASDTTPHCHCALVEQVWVSDFQLFSNLVGEPAGNRNV